jgi:hypothetical protein
MKAHLISESKEWISIKLDTGGMHQTLPGQFNFGSHQSSIAHTLREG